LILHSTSNHKLYFAFILFLNNNTKHQKMELAIFSKNLWISCLSAPISNRAKTTIFSFFEEFRQKSNIKQLFY